MHRAFIDSVLRHGKPHQSEKRKPVKDSIATEEDTTTLGDNYTIGSNILIAKKMSKELNN